MEVGRFRNSVELTTWNCLVSTSHKITSLGIWFVTSRCWRTANPSQFTVSAAASMHCHPVTLWANTHCLLSIVIQSHHAEHFRRWRIFIHVSAIDFQVASCSLLLALLLLRTSLTAHIHMVANMTCQSGNSLLQHTLRLTNRCNFIIRSNLLSNEAESCLIQLCRASKLRCARERNFLDALLTLHMPPHTRELSLLARVLHCCLATVLLWWSLAAHQGLLSL